MSRLPPPKKLVNRTEIIIPLRPSRAGEAEEVDFRSACDGHLDDLRASRGGWANLLLREGVMWAIQPMSLSGCGSPAAMCASN